MLVCILIYPLTYFLQGVNQLKNFDIKNEAGGVDKHKITKIKNIRVTNGTLEIRFQYVGKGTSFIPEKGVFGPLISAISMESGTLMIHMSFTFHH